MDENYNNSNTVKTGENGDNSTNVINDKTDSPKTLTNMVNVINIPDNLALTLTDTVGSVDYVSSGRFYAITRFGSNPNINNDLIKSAIIVANNLLQDISFNNNERQPSALVMEAKTKYNNTIPELVNNKEPVYTENKNVTILDNNDSKTKDLNDLIQLLEELFKKHNLNKEIIKPNDETSNIVIDGNSNETKNQVIENNQIAGSNRRKKLLNKTKQKLKGRQRKTKTSKRLRR